MGYAKYSEDIWDQIEINREKLNPVLYSLKSSEIVHTIKCLYCEEEFDQNEALFSHYRLRHNQLGPIMKLNGKVMQVGEHIEAAVESLRYYPVENIDSISVNGREHKANISDGYIDIKTFQKNEFETLNILIAGEEWIIHRSNLITVSSKVDIIIIEMNDNAINRQRPNLEEINKKIREYKLDIRDIQYVNGFYEYYLACSVEGRDKDRLYFGAYNKLLPFIEKKSRARLIIKIICLRYLWIERLAELCRISKPNEFSMVYSFLSGYIESMSEEDEKHSDTIFEIFVEDNEYENTQEIINFMKQKYNAVKRYLGEALNLTGGRENNPNLLDKIYLLQARMSEVNVNVEKYRYYIKKIKNSFINTKTRRTNNESI